MPCRCRRRRRPRHHRGRQRPTSPATSHEETTLTYETILTETVGDGPLKTGVIRLNRPKQMNALSDQLMDELGAALLAFDADNGIGAIVLTGNERAFAAGADISIMAKYDYMDAFKKGHISRNWETMRQVRKPVIAA